jgi:hypothetical protein
VVSGGKTLKHIPCSNIIHGERERMQFNMCEMWVLRVFLDDITNNDDRVPTQLRRVGRLVFTFQNTAQALW